MDLPFNRDALLPGLRVRSWVIEDVLSAGRGAIVYRASGERPDDLVAIKEYFPAKLVTRTADLEVAPREPTAEAPLRLGMRRFAHDMHVLLELTQQGGNDGLPSVVEVLKAYGGVHAVMAYEPGTPLAQLLAAGHRFDEAALLRIVRTLGGALAKLHDAGVRHGAITPRDILIGGPRGPVLLGFGTGEESRADASADPSPYAPIERYAPVHPEGPWTDIYSLGAVLRHCVTGEPPSDVIERKAGDRLADVARLGFSEAFLRAVDAAMETTPQRRPQSADEWLTMFPAEAARADAGRPAAARQRHRLPLLLAATVPAVAALAWLAVPREETVPPQPRPVEQSASVAAPDLGPLDAGIERTAAAAGRIRAIIDDLGREDVPPAALATLRSTLDDVERDLADQQTTRNEVAGSGNANSAREAARLFGQIDLRIANSELAARRAQIAAYEAMAATKRREQHLAARAPAVRAEAPVAAPPPSSPPRAERPVEPDIPDDERTLLARADRDIRAVQDDYNQLRRQIKRSYGEFGDRGDRRTYARAKDIYESIYDLHGLRRRLARTESAGTARRLYRDFAARRDRISDEIKDVGESL